MPRLTTLEDALAEGEGVSPLVAPEDFKKMIKMEMERKFLVKRFKSPISIMVCVAQDSYPSVEVKITPEFAHHCLEWNEGFSLGIEVLSAIKKLYDSLEVPRFKEGPLTENEHKILNAETKQP